MNTITGKMHKKNINQPSDKQTLKWIFNASKPQIPVIIALIIGNAVWACFGTITALFSKEIIDSATGGNRDRMFLFIGIYLAVALSLILVHAFMRYATERCRAKLEILFRNKVFSSMLSKSYPKLSEHHTGDLVNRLTGDIAVISDAATSIIPHVVMMTVRLVFAMVVLIKLKWQLALFFGAGGIIIFSMS